MYFECLYVVMFNFVIFVNVYFWLDVFIYELVRQRRQK